jgi:hypothetical protein
VSIFNPIHTIFLLFVRKSIGSYRILTFLFSPSNVLWHKKPIFGAKVAKSIPDCHRPKSGTTIAHFLSPPKADLKYTLRANRLLLTLLPQEISGLS